MESLRPEKVSVIDPIGPAIERVKLMLFRPFDLSRWFVIGFCAWLAFLGQGGGGGSGFNGNFPGKGHHAGTGAHGMENVGNVVHQYLPLIIIGAVAVAVFFFIIGIVLCWLKSRGQFMLVHCVSGNKAEVVVPWNKFARHGNSVFLFKVFLWIIGLVVIIVPVVVIIFAAVALSRTGFQPLMVVWIVACAFFIIAFSILTGLITKFTDDFVVPIMALQTQSVMAGWKTFVALLSVNKARILLYILFQIIILMVIGIIGHLICIVACCFCCCTLVLFSLPYISTVILLPLFIFRRAYSLLYLRQFGPQFDVFNPQSPEYPL
jgi:hypothetical protein